MILTQNIFYDRVFIVQKGELELSFHLTFKEIPFDVLTEEGCTINSTSCLIKEKIHFSAKAVIPVTMLSICLADIQAIANRRADLRKSIKLI